MCRYLYFLHVIIQREDATPHLELTDCGPGWLSDLIIILCFCSFQIKVVSEEYSISYQNIV